MKIEFKKDGIVVGGEFVALSVINTMCNKASVEEDNLVLMKMGWSGRSGDVLEQRVLPLEKALRLKELLLGRQVYFGEIWGKHSEVYGDMCESTFTIVEDKLKVSDFLAKFPGGVDYDHSFVHTYLERLEEKLEYGSDELEEDETQELYDEIEALIN